MMIHRFWRGKRSDYHQSYFIKFINIILILMLAVPIMNFGIDIISNNSRGDIVEGYQIITVPTTWESDHRNIKSHIVIASSGSLTIKKGININFEGKFTIFVEGKLYINGTTHKPIRLQPKSTPTPGFWNGITVNKTGKIDISFAIIDYATTGIYLDQSENCTINSTIVRYGSGSGIVCNSTNNTSLNDNYIFKNQLTGILLKSAENTTIKYNTVNANQNGIYLNDSKNNVITNNSISSSLSNTHDDYVVLTNNWDSNYYGDYIGVDDGSGGGIHSIVGDYIGDNANYGIGGGGVHQDYKPKTKIKNDQNSKTYASIIKAVEQSTAAMAIIVPVKTPNAGSRTLNQTGYYYENILIDSLVNHDVNIFSPSPTGYKNTFIDGNSNFCIEVNGNYKLRMGGFTITNSAKGIYLHTDASGLLHNLSFKNNGVGIELDSVTEATIKDSTFEDNIGTGGIVLVGSRNVKILDNDFNNNLYGISLFGSDNNKISNNSCNSNLISGICLNVSTNNTISDNEMISNVEAGLFVLDGSDYNSFINNDYLNNKDGIRLINSKNNKFTGSVIKANPNWGVYFNSQANNNIFQEIGGNDFKGSNISINTNNSANNTFRNCTIMESLTGLILWLDYNASIIFLHTNFDKDGLVFQDLLSTLTVKYYLTVRTLNNLGEPLQGAKIKVTDNKSKLIVENNTNIDGELSLIQTVSFIQNQISKDYSSNDHVIYANDSISEKVAYLDITTPAAQRKVFLKQFKFDYTPIIIGEDNLTAFEKKNYSVSYDVMNFEKNKNVTWEINTNSSSWLQIDEQNMTVFGIPHNRDVGRPWVSVIARDIDGDAAERNFTLTIINTRPEIITPNQLTTYEDELYNVDYNSSDDDGYYNETMVLLFPEKNLTTWYLQTNGSWLKFDNESGILNGTPRNNHVGTFFVSINVDDGNGGLNSTSYILTVINTPPEILTEDIEIAYKNAEYYNDYNSSDDEFGNMTWVLRTSAKWLAIDNETGVLRGTPGYDDVNAFWVNVTVIDDHGGKESRNFTLQVIDLNAPPRILTEPVTVAYTNKLYSVQYLADDQDTPLINLSWELALDTNTSVFTIDPETGILSGTPLPRHGGNWSWINVTVLDNEGGRDYQKFKLFILRSPNIPPILLETSLIEDNEITISAFNFWEHKFDAKDDYTAVEDLRWSLKTNASWLLINTTNGKVSGTPVFEHVGVYWVNVTVADEDGLFNFTNFTVHVKHINQAPTLLDAGMHPLNGTTDTTFIFYVTYMDLDNDSGSVFVVIDNKSYPMVPDPRGASRYYLGVNFTYKTKLGSGKHTYYFEAKDAWGSKAKLGPGVPSKRSPAQTNSIKKIVHKPFWENPLCWVTGVIIIIILLCILQFVLKPLSKRYPKLEFVNKIKVPDKINPVVYYRTREDREAGGEFGFLCPNCRSLVAEDATKCEECGEKFTMVDYLCPNCEAEVSGTDLFCPKCGSKFEELSEEELKEVEPEIEEELKEEEPELEKEPEKEKESDEEKEEFEDEPESILTRETKKEIEVSKLDDEEKIKTKEKSKLAHTKDTTKKKQKKKILPNALTKLKRKKT